MTQIRVDPSQLQSLAGDCDRSANSVEQDLVRLRSAVSEAVSSTASDLQRGLESMATVWQGALNDLSQALRADARTLRTVADRFAQVDSGGGNGGGGAPSGGMRGYPTMLTPPSPNYQMDGQDNHASDSWDCGEAAVTSVLNDFGVPVKRGAVRGEIDKLLGRRFEVSGTSAPTLATILNSADYHPAAPIDARAVGGSARDVVRTNLAGGHRVLCLVTTDPRTRRYGSVPKAGNGHLHWVECFGFDGTSYHIMNPNYKGPQTIPASVFEAACDDTGVAQHFVTIGAVAPQDSRLL